MPPFAPSRVDVEVAVRVLVGDPGARILSWKMVPVSWRIVSEVTGGLYRLRGALELNGVRNFWSLVIKVSEHPPSTVSGNAANDRREALAYTSGIFKPHLGFATARLLAVTQPTSEETWLWLEDVVDEGDELLSVSRLALAARHLGVFNGSNLIGLDGGPEWLFRNWLPGLRPLPSGEETATVLRPDTWQLPAVQAVFPAPALEDLVRLAAQAPEFCREIEVAPQSLCHLDPGRFNLCVRNGGDGRDETVFLDWQMLGVGPLGADLAMMNTLNLYRLYVGPDEAQDYSLRTLSSYVEGLRDAGVEANETSISFAYRAVAALRAGAIVRVIVFNLAKRAETQTAIPSWGVRLRLKREETWRAWGENMCILMNLV